MSAHRPRILVIDDEAQIHLFLSPALEAAGYEALRADTAAEGLAMIATRAPDAVILDLGLPDMDGKEALGRARRSGCDLRAKLNRAPRAGRCADR